MSNHKKWNVFANGILNESPYDLRIKHNRAEKEAIAWKNAEELFGISI